MSRSSKRIVLTGVSRGLGLAMVEQFAERGHVVCGCARSADAIETLRSRFASPHSFSVVDVASETEVAGWAMEVLGSGAPDLLINNAAIMNRSAPLWDVPAGEFSTIVDVNIKGTYHVIRHFAPAMIARGRGVIVNISSGWGRSVAGDVAPYCTTKWAIEGLTRALAEELPPGLAAVPLNPGIIDTEMLRSCFGEGAANYPDPTTWARRTVPFLLKLGPSDNGQPLTAPGSE
jgi:NAD(P)-dependent dehydrogenase (short-subunit alcohol dehydrogenase family)